MVTSCDLKVKNPRSLAGVATIPARKASIINIDETGGLTGEIL